ncbi:arrestin C-terminal domain-containing protein [Chloropicon primus]|uniref:Arrestin C-terminal-like domain-containing protein n=2 Tax=Chloropicon primus TaxID=1764295 RepID=A0A5B8MJY7_9CHLO|nr:hypothetical protein A3770_03p21900 [Chloropicon primus]UPQ98884.1 arrestin C-terminal domain-containing protein [Chloropicon primus]|eukprot:QDZ19672.1 hypothetical protein A3770_03p21900 [Chloropicon primus]
MGNGGSKYGEDVGVFGDLEVNVRGGHAVAGEELRGQAYVRWNPRKMDHQTQYRVVVKVTGEEETSVEYQRDDDFYDDGDGPSTRRTRRITEYARQRNVFYTDSLLLCAVLNKRSGRRDLRLPFAFALPPRLPTSMIDPFSSGRSWCRVQYKVEILLEEFAGPGAGGGWFSGSNNFLHAIPFNLYNPPPHPSRHFPVDIPPKSEVVNVCCCFGQGLVTIAAHLPSGFQASGSAINVGFEIVNNSEVDAESIVLRAKESLSWTAESQRQSREHVLAENRIPARDIPGLMKRNSSKEAKESTTKLIPSASNNQHMLTVQLPESSCESYQGRLLSVRHSIELEVVTGSFTSNPTLRADFICFRLPGQAVSYEGSAAPLVPSAPPIPPGWNPVEVPFTAPPKASAVPLAQQGATGPSPDLQTEALVQALALSFDAVTDVKDFVARGGGNNISPQQLASILKAVKLKLNQPLVARELMEIKTKAITCEHAAAAAAASEESTRGDVVRALGPFIVDPENAERVVRPQLSPFQYTLVEPTLRRYNTSP